MARVRGLSNAERLAVKMITVTATGTALSAPVFLYQVFASLTDSTVTGVFSLGDSTASGDVAADGVRLDFKIGAGGASATVADRVAITLVPPVYVANSLSFVNATGIAKVSCTYLAAS